MTIVCGVDFSEVSEQAARVARAWAEALGAKLLLVSCADDLPITAGPGILTPIHELNAMRLEGLKNGLSKMAETLGYEATEVRAVYGAPAQKIAEVAAESDADLVVVGSHGCSALAGILLGHVADRVVRLTDRPTLVVRRTHERLERWPGSGSPLAVTAAVDFDGSSERAIAFLHLLRRIGPCDITLAHVYKVPDTLPTFSEEARGDVTRVEEHIEAGLRTRLLDLVDDLPGSGRIETHLAPTWGPVADLVRREVEATQPDLLVAGSHGRRGLALLWHGSVTQTLLHHIRVSTVIAPQRSSEEAAPAAAG